MAGPFHGVVVPLALGAGALAALAHSPLLTAAWLALTAALAVACRRGRPAPIPAPVVPVSK